MVQSRPVALLVPASVRIGAPMYHDIRAVSTYNVYGYSVYGTISLKHFLETVVYTIYNFLSVDYS